MLKKLIIGALGVTLGNIATNVVTLRANGWSFNTKTMRWEKQSTQALAPVEELEVKTKMGRNNLIWCAIGLVVGQIVRSTNK